MTKRLFEALETTLWYARYVCVLTPRLHGVWVLYHPQEKEAVEVFHRGGVKGSEKLCTKKHSEQQQELQV